MQAKSTAQACLSYTNCELALSIKSLLEASTFWLGRHRFSPQSVLLEEENWSAPEENHREPWLGCTGCTSAYVHHLCFLLVLVVRFLRVHKGRVMCRWPKSKRA